MPRWVRRLGFAAVLAHGALFFAWVGHPDACMDVWSMEDHRGGCCAMSNQTRWSREGGDCCDYGRVEDREHGASTSGPSVPPAAAALLPAPVTVAVAPPASRVRGVAHAPERPPDRGLRTTILLI